MFEQTRETVLDKLCAEYDLGAEHRAIVEGLSLIHIYLANIVKQSRHHNCLHSAMPESMEVHHKLHCVVCHVHLSLIHICL